MRNFAVLLFLLSITHFAYGQKGYLKINKDADLDSLIEKNKNLNKIKNVMDGFRIQLFSGTERNNANQLKAKFLAAYPTVPAYLIYQQPYFKLRVGDFRNKMEAQYLFNSLSSEFNQAILVADKINFPKLK
jgi:hypothetical protein